MSALKLEFPDVAGLPQHEEWCRVVIDGKTETLRFHDYARIYGVPGLYEELFYGRLECSSPKTVAALLSEELAKVQQAPGSLRGLDLGAGNGMVGEELRRLGVASLVGIDILPEAAAAARRDRPDVYADYVVADLTALDDVSRARLVERRPNLLSTVAALGFGDIPSRAFATAWELLETPAWVAFNIKEDFLAPRYQHGFSLLVKRLVDSGRYQVRAQRTYVHRLALDGTPLRYQAFIGTKTAAIPPEWWAELD